VDRSRALEILGLPQSATPADIRRRFRELALRYHPDVGGDRERMSLISRAYAVLISSTAEESQKDVAVSAGDIRKMISFLSSLPLHPKMAAELRRIGASAVLGGYERGKILHWFRVLARAWRASDDIDEAVRRMLIVRLSNMLVRGDASEEHVQRVIDAYNVASALLKYLGDVGVPRGGGGIKLPRMVGGVLAGMLKGVRGTLIALLEPRTTIGADELWQRVESIRRQVASAIEFARRVSQLYDALEGVPFGGRWRREIDAEVLKLAVSSQSVDGISRLERAVDVVSKIQRLGREISSRLWNLGAPDDVLEWASGYSRLTAMGDVGIDGLIADGERIVGELESRLSSLDLLQKALGLASALEILLAPYRPDIKGTVVKSVWRHWLAGDMDDFIRVLEQTHDSVRSHIADADLFEVLKGLVEKVIG